MKQVYIANDPPNAEIVKDYLESHGIEAQVRGSYLWGGRGEVPTNAFPEVWVVNDADYRRARDLALELEKAPLRAGPDWTCPGCGERLAGQFTACWHCGYQREDAL